MTAADRKQPPGKDLQRSDTQGHQTHQVEHDAPEAPPGTANRHKTLFKSFYNASPFDLLHTVITMKLKQPEHVRQIV